MITDSDWTIFKTHILNVLAEKPWTEIHAVLLAQELGIPTFLWDEFCSRVAEDGHPFQLEKTWITRSTGEPTNILIWRKGEPRPAL